MSALPINVFNGRAEAVEFLWDHIAPHLPLLPDEFPRREASLQQWLLQPDAQCFIVGDPTSPSGIMHINGIQPGLSANAHVIMWDRGKTLYLDRVNAARAVAFVVMNAHNLKRLSGFTPASLLPALRFLIHVGFEREGRMKKAVLMQGQPYDLIVSGLTDDRLVEVLKQPGALIPVENEIMEADAALNEAPFRAEPTSQSEAPQE